MLISSVSSALMEARGSGWPIARSAVQELRMRCEAGCRGGPGRMNPGMGEDIYNGGCW